MAVAITRYEPGAGPGSSLLPGSYSLSNESTVRRTRSFV